jgi:hypothetical protein
LMEHPMVAQSKIRACDEVVCVLHAACFFVQHCGWRVFKACMLACMRMVQRVYIVLELPLHLVCATAVLDGGLP